MGLDWPVSYDEAEYSGNAKAEELFGRRREDVIAFDQPAELGYVCPKCGEDYGGLCWSEYNCFIWCSVCNLDIPSALCVPHEGYRNDRFHTGERPSWDFRGGDQGYAFHMNIEDAIHTYLSTVEQAIYNHERKASEVNVVSVGDKAWIAEGQ